MQIITKNDFVYNFDESDYIIIQDYLNEVFKRSTWSYKNQKATILNLLNYLNKDLQKITMIDIRNYFERTIDKKENIRNNNPISIDTKEAYRSYIKSFFDYVIGRFLENDIELRNPVPNKGIYKFTQLDTDIQKRSNVNNEIFTEKELLDLLKYSKKHNPRDFVLFSLLNIDGPRISEVLTIEIKNINFKERYFETGFIKDARKTTRISKKSLIFFFPESFKPFLKQYINYIGKENAWLFPGRKTHLKYTSFREYVITNYNTKDHIFHKFHKFRKTLISNRLIKMKCPLWISEGLTNHQISDSTQIKHYAKFSIAQKRELFDKYFPYYDFPYF